MLKLAVMEGRLALIVGSQCDSLPRLSFVSDCASGLHAELRTAGWQPVGAPDGLLLNPRVADLKKAVEHAFSAANEAGATLLFAFIGHGEARATHNFYLMAVDSPSSKPNSDNAFHLPQFVTERLIEFPSLDGAVLLIDACQAKEGVEGAAARWTEVVAANRARIELLVASGADSAYDGCFTHTMLDTFRTGLEDRGENLLCADLQPAISNKCWKSQTQYLAYAGGDVSSGRGDPGLWLVPNTARSRDAVTGRPAAGLLDQLTSGVIVTDAMRETLAAIEDSAFARLRLVVGAAGTGKSTLLGLFIRPKKAKALGVDLGVADDYIKAAVFLDISATVETMATELALQLASNVPEFHMQAAAVTDELTQEDLKTLDSWEISVMRPLARLKRPGVKVPIIVDGLDQPEQGAREVILSALKHITDTAPAAEMGHVRIIAGVRSGEGIDNRDELAPLAHAHRIDVTPPTVAEIAAAATTQPGVQLSEDDLADMIGDVTTGGWLIARLVREIADHVPGTTGFGNLTELVTARTELALRGDTAGVAAKMLSLITAAGAGPVLPIRLLAATLLPLAQIRDRVVEFGPLISRGKPGTDHETLGIAHLAFLQPILDHLNQIGCPVADAHRALIDAQQRHLTDRDFDNDADATHDEVAGYWSTAAPRHYLGSGDPQAAIEFLETLDTPRAADNRDRWAGWLPAFTTTLGADHPETLTTRGHLARWRGEAGDVAGAVAEYQAVLADRVRVLGADHPDTLTIRHSLAHWRGQAGDAPGALAEYQAVLADRVRVVGADHPDTLTTRHSLAIGPGQGGDPPRRCRIPGGAGRPVRVLGADHPDTLTTRDDLAFWRGQAGMCPARLPNTRRCWPTGCGCSAPITPRP